MANNRKHIRLFLLLVMIFTFLLNLDGITRKGNNFLEKMVSNNLAPKGLLPVKISAAQKKSSHFQISHSQWGFSSHPRKNRETVNSFKPPSNGLPYRKRSNQSLSKYIDAKSKDADKRNSFKYEASETSSLTKWMNALKNPKISYKKYLLVIITTWSPSKEKQLVHENVVRLWSYWPKLVQPIAYLLPHNNTVDQKNKESFIKDTNTLIKNGWIIRPVPKVSCGDIPVLKFMILDAMKLFPKSHFYGYANSDILFDSGLIETLKSTQQLVPVHVPVLVIGRRINLNVMRRVRFENPDSVLKAAKKGSLMGTRAIDYFITNNLFPWEKIPDLVVGRIHYDNWMVYFGISQYAIVIDATETLMAVHQTTADGNNAGVHRANPYCNKNMIERLGKPFISGWGQTVCTPYKALRNPNTGFIELKTRQNLFFCKPNPPQFVFSTGTNFTYTIAKQKI